MTNQGTGNRDQGTGPSAGGMQELLRRAVAPVADETGPERDLWPAMLRRIEEKPGCAPAAAHAVPWFDWALAGALILLVAVSPGLAPVLLYYL